MWPWPPSWSAAPPASWLPPDQSINAPPEFHQLEPFSMTARQSHSMPAGVFCVIAVFAADELQFARRLESLPQQPIALEPQMGLEGILTTQMFTNFRYRRYGCPTGSLKRFVIAAAMCISSVPPGMSCASL